jgi:hypothetical protein
MAGAFLDANGRMREANGRFIAGLGAAAPALEGIAGGATQAATAFQDVVINAGAAEEPIRRAGKSAQEGIIGSREGLRLLNEEFGLHLPRAITTAISKIEGMNNVLQAAGRAALILFAAREIADAITNWDKFAKKVTDFGAPFGELGIRVGQFFGLWSDYSAKATAEAQRLQKVVEAGIPLSARVLDATGRLNELRATGEKQIQVATQASIDKLALEAGAADQGNRVFFDRLIQIEKQIGATRIAQAQAQEQLTIDEAQIESTKRVADARISYQEQLVKGMKFDIDEERTALVDLENQKYTIERTSLQRRLALEPQMRIEIQGQLQALEFQHLGRILAIDDDAETKKEAILQKEIAAVAAANTAIQRLSNDLIKTYQKESTEISTALDRMIVKDQDLTMKGRAFTMQRIQAHLQEEISEINFRVIQAQNLAQMSGNWTDYAITVARSLQAIKAAEDAAAIQEAEYTQAVLDAQKARKQGEEQATISQVASLVSLVAGRRAAAVVEAIWNMAQAYAAFAGGEIYQGIMYSLAAAEYGLIAGGVGQGASAGIGRVAVGGGTGIASAGPAPSSELAPGYREATSTQPTGTVMVVQMSGSDFTQYVADQLSKGVRQRNVRLYASHSLRVAGGNRSA